MRALILFLFLAISATAFAQRSGRFEITRSVIAGVGSAPISSARFQLTGTVAQPLAAIPAGNRFSIQGGFWIWPAPIILPPTINGTNVVLIIQTEPGNIYSVQSVNSLSAAPAWQTISTVTGNGSIMGATNSTSNSSQQFYRVIGQ